MKLTRNFTLQELIHSDTAQQSGITGQFNPPPEVVDNLKHLADTVLQPLRFLYGKPIHISSGWRSEALNRAVGGSPTSEHLQGIACDIDVSEGNGLLLLLLLTSNIQWGQLIIEKGSYINPEWLHISSFRSTKHSNSIWRYNGKVYTRLNKQQVITKIWEELRGE
ncbi:MAG: putative peptidase M15 [Prokaryotic dsDNA virus sp.]|nr:MAG: putative peptidase M15 [Prokaryotic dsDNA virus sp.]|tara:strand:- start:5572 stop:6066 length:495 start_codon:yes stop_codon:yes gene_type:complete